MKARVQRALARHCVVTFLWDNGRYRWPVYRAVTWRGTFILNFARLLGYVRT